MPTEPVRLLPGLRALMAAHPASADSDAGRIQLRADHAGRPSAAEFRRRTACRRRFLDHRPAGFSRPRRNPGQPERRRGASGRRRQFQGRAQRRIRPIRIRWWHGCRAAAISPIAAKSRCGCAAMSASAPDRVAIDAMKAEIDGGAVEGRVAVSHPAAGGGSRFDAELKAERLDLDAAAALVRSLAGPQAEWPDEAQLSLDVGRAISAGQELRPLLAKLGYGPKTISLDQLKIGEAGGVMMEGAGSFDRANATGKLALNSSAASFGQHHRADRAAGAVGGGAAQCDGNAPGPGAPASWRSISTRTRGRPIAPMRAPCSISMRRSSRASPRSPQSRRRGHQRHRHRSDRRSEIRGRDQTVVGAGRFAAGAAGSRSRHCGRRGRRRNSKARSAAHGARRCG